MPTEFISFTGTVPENYDRYLGPFLFEPCARHLVNTLETGAIQSVLEIACGTGRVTKYLREHFPKPVTIIATDLNVAMLHIAKTNLGDDSILFKEADVEELPFADNSFDLVVCQYGIMFVPDKQKAFREMFRVLKKNGKLIFNTWDKLENNRPAFIVSNVVSEYFHHDIPNFYKLPYGTYNTKEIETMLKACDFRDIKVEEILSGVKALLPKILPQVLLQAHLHFMKYK